ncbi:unnamed protein product [Parascedosporium putredinis]|uniref:Uncharacterized protein n=1 Tax=Parascedosporium putredinis TaxID=1442378 RepID=A0A9P1GZW5_9PEZI|nr:unnamed protein product [Parascedosporium putredinis]CAI7992241.1 unnamed protein product [Parascedosporium putredinis]
MEPRGARNRASKIAEMYIPVLIPTLQFWVTWQWPTAAVLTVLLSLFAAQTAAAGIIQQRALVHEWISIDSGGTPITHTPEVKTKNGAVSTVVSVPYILTGTVYTVSGSAGLITWDTTFFAGDQQDSEIRVEVRWTPSNTSVTSFNVRAGNGYVPMLVTEAFMRGTSKNDKALHMVMFYTEESGEAKETEGPTIYATTEEISVVDIVKRPGRKGVHPAAIAVPVVVAVLALGVGFFCLWRKNKDKLVLSRIRRRSSQGYGVSKSRTQRVPRPRMAP